MRLAVSIAAHSPLMSTAQERFNQVVEATHINPPLIPIIGNVTARPLLDSASIKSDLENQLTHRVRWTETIRYLVSQGVSEFIEIGSGAVLCGLIKRIDSYQATAAIGSPDDFSRFIKL
jgi:[acyl-carrier-protein] S-malonyltransferase